MSAGTISLHSLAGFSAPGGPGGPGGRRSGEPVDDQDYLEPTPPLQPPPIDPGYKYRREGARPRANLRQDLDSGVVDLDGLHMVLDNNMNGLSPRMPGDHVTDRMRRPDSLAVKGHEYEELPGSRQHTRFPYADMEDNSSRSGSGGSRPLPVPMLNELKLPHTHTGSSDSLCRPLSGTSSNGGVNNERFSNAYRKRENPLYDEGDADDLQLKLGPGGFLACPCSGVIFVGLIACTSFLLALLLIVGIFNGNKEVSLAPETAALVRQLNQSELLTALSNMKRLESQYKHLMQKYTLMETALNLAQLNNGSITSKVDTNSKAIELLLTNSGLSLPTAKTLFEKMDHYDSVEQKQNESIGEIYSKVSSLHYKLDQLNSSVRQELSSLRNDATVTRTRIARIENDFTHKLSLLNANLTNQVYQIGKLQGPKGDRGPPGVSGSGNLSDCEYWFKRSGNPTSAAETSTDWWPADNSDIQKWVITGLECTTEMGETSLLEIQPLPAMASVDQFRCVCRGSIGGATSRFCKLNVWRCPRIT